MREFLYVEDMASACVFIASLNNVDYNKHVKPMKSWINIGTGKDIEIKELAKIIKEIVGYEGDIQFDTNMPDGAPRKLLDVNLINAIGWQSKISLENGLRLTYEDFKNNYG